MADKNKGVLTEVVSTSSNRLTEEKLAGITNFQHWKRIVVIVLTGREQNHHLTGARTAADTKWDTMDARILGQMWNSMESHVAALVTHATTVKDLWDYLNVLYSGENNLSRIYEISQDFFRADRKNRSLTQFFADFKQMYEEFNHLLPITSDVKTMQEQREQLAVMGFLGALGPEFDAVRSQILGGNNVPSLTETFSRVLRVSRESSKDISPTGDSSALAVQGNRGGGQGRGGGRSGRGFNSGGSGRGFNRGQS
ncbi:uncharacterized protein LOC115679796 [Syzygium oleosum]|uniref:uncharacterized protein LOC115679796 n=1 Tax=Syzygium oleosum TaxID=219896 RepID=UPI0024BB0FBA|nr:uncharacterized protein LOC115679796 [Syzygium oleosum]